MVFLEDDDRFRDRARFHAGKNDHEFALVVVKCIVRLALWRLHESRFRLHGLPRPVGLDGLRQREMHALRGLAEAGGLPREILRAGFRERLFDAMQHADAPAFRRHVLHLLVEPHHAVVRVARRRRGIGEQRGRGLEQRQHLFAHERRRLKRHRLRKARGGQCARERGKNGGREQFHRAPD